MLREKTRMVETTPHVVGFTLLALGAVGLGELVFSGDLAGAVQRVHHSLGATSAHHDFAASATTSHHKKHHLSPTKAAATAAVAARAATAARASSAARAGGARAAGGAKAHSSRATSKMSKGKIKKAEVRAPAVKAVGPRFGDVSSTYRLPGFAALDEVMVASTVTAAAYTPFGSAALLDGAYLRAAIGPLAMLLPVIGAALGLVAAIQTGFTSATPMFGLFLAILILGILDALSGLLASAVFLGAVLLAGGLFSLSAVASAIFIGALWCGIPIMIGKLRSFTRSHPEDIHQWWVRTGDLIGGTFLAGFIAYSLIETIAIISPAASDLSGHAVQIGFCVGAAAAFRYLTALFVAYAYPVRLATLTSHDLPERPMRHDLGSVMLRILFAAMLFAAFLGLHWVILIMALLYGLDVGLQGYLRRYSYSSEWSKLIPHNVVKLLVVTVLSVLVASQLGQLMDSSFWKIVAGLIAVLVIATIFDALAAPSTKSFEISWWTRLAGAVVMVLLIAQCLGLLVT